MLINDFHYFDAFSIRCLLQCTIDSVLSVQRASRYSRLSPKWHAQSDHALHLQIYSLFYCNFCKYYHLAFIKRCKGLLWRVNGCVGGEYEILDGFRFAYWIHPKLQHSGRSAIISWQLYIIVSKRTHSIWCNPTPTTLHWQNIYFFLIRSPWINIGHAQKSFITSRWR